MEWLKFIIQVLVTPFLIVFGIWLVFWKGYWKKKAENIATKEDISEITNEVESVKIQFQKDFADYQLLGQHQFSLIGEQRKAILKYNEALNFLINMTLNSMHDSDLLTYEEPDAALKRFFDWNSKFLNAYHTLILLMPNVALEELHKGMYKRLSAMQRLIMKHLHSFDKEAYKGEVKTEEVLKFRESEYRDLVTEVNNIYLVLKDENKEMMKILQNLIQIAFKKTPA